MGGGRDISSHIPTLPFSLSSHFKDKETEAQRGEISQSEPLTEPNSVRALRVHWTSPVSSAGFAEGGGVWYGRVRGGDISQRVPYWPHPTRLQAFKIAWQACELPPSGWREREGALLGRGLPCGC